MAGKICLRETVRLSGGSLDEQTHLDLFSGIGGFAVAAGWAGYSTRVFCEQDAYCTKVLKRHWPDVPIISDIRDFDGSKWRGAGLLTGGFPCQPFSQAGERRGEEDDRHLWPQMLRVIKEARPNFVLAENVAGLINMALDDVLSQLEGEGYTAGAVVLPACSLNAPHRRDRVWIMAHASGAATGSIAGEVGDENRSSSGQQLPTLRQADGAVGSDRTNATSETLAHAKCGGSQGWHGDRKATEQPGAICSDISRYKQNAEGWRVEPNVGRVAHGIPSRTHRLKALGNAIVPQVAYEILKLTTETTQQKET